MKLLELWKSPWGGVLAGLVMLVFSYWLSTTVPVQVEGQHLNLADVWRTTGSLIFGVLGVLVFFVCLISSTEKPL